MTVEKREDGLFHVEVDLTREQLNELWHRLNVHDHMVHQTTDYPEHVDSFEPWREDDLFYLWNDIDNVFRLEHGADPEAVAQMSNEATEVHEMIKHGGPLGGLAALFADDQQVTVVSVDEDGTTHQFPDPRDVGELDD